jgi:hypothetical protein
MKKKKTPANQDVIEKLLEEINALTRGWLEECRRHDEARELIEVNLPRQVERRRAERRKPRSKGGRQSAERRKQDADAAAAWQKQVAKQHWIENPSLSANDVVKKIQDLQKTKPYKVELRGGEVVHLPMSRRIILGNIASVKPPKSG